MTSAVQHPGSRDGNAPTPQDLEAVETQLGRLPRGVHSVAHRCPCGAPDVVRTQPRLPDGTPFPTSYYATCPKMTGAISTLESEGMMREMSERVTQDEELAAAYARAHEDYLERRAELGDVPEVDGISAGGMPTRVKCLHVLVGHALARGEGVNVLGDEALAALPDWWETGCCLDEAAEKAAAEAKKADQRNQQPGGEVSAG